MDGLGSKLQQERLARNIELQDISKATRISMSVLRDIENNNFSKYTGDEEYIKMYLRKYSEYLGIDAREYINDYITLTSTLQLDGLENEVKKEVKEKKQVTIANPKYAKSKKVYESQETKNYIRYGIILLLMIAIFGVVYFMISIMNNSDKQFKDPTDFNVSGDVSNKEDEKENTKEDEQDDENEGEEENTDGTVTASGIRVEHPSPYVYTVNVPANEETFNLKFSFVTQTWCKLVVNGQLYPNFAAKIYNEANVTNDLNATPEEVEYTFNTNETYSIVLTNGHNVGHHYYINGQLIETPESEESESNVDITFNIVKE